MDLSQLHSFRLEAQRPRNKCPLSVRNLGCQYKQEGVEPDNDLREKPSGRVAKSQSLRKLQGSFT